MVSQVVEQPSVSEGDVQNPWCKVLSVVCVARGINFLLTYKKSTQELQNGLYINFRSILNYIEKYNSLTSVTWFLRFSIYTRVLTHVSEEDTGKQLLYLSQYIDWMTRVPFPARANDFSCHYRDHICLGSTKSPIRIVYRTPYRWGHAVA
jgi:hypothetical protein